MQPVRGFIDCDAWGAPGWPRRLREPIKDQNGVTWCVTVSTAGAVSCVPSFPTTPAVLSTAPYWVSRTSPDGSA
jgi:hypothetical protein